MRWYILQFEHNSHELIYRDPFGACPVRSKVRLRLLVMSSESPEKVFCVINNSEISMVLSQETDRGLLYECTVTMPLNPTLVFYYFRIEAKEKIYYYSNNRAFLGGIGEIYDSMPEKLFQITVYDKNYKTPDWMKNAVVYQIFPDRFFRGKDTPFHGIERKWGEEPYYQTQQFGEKYLSNDFFGGNFDGIRQKLPYLKELGITAIYLNPVSKAFSNHRYDTGDYTVPDETLGTTEDFEILCKDAGRLGIKIILDGVYSHTGSDSLYFNKDGYYDGIGAYQSTDSPYYSWYSFTDFPDKYDCWWGFETLPNVNELDENYIGYIIGNDDSVISQWIDRGAMGFRLDVADELPDEFIKKLRKALKKKNPDALLIGEVWEDASNKISYGERREFLLGNELDSVMNYVFREAVLSYLLNCNSRLFSQKIMSLLENYPKESLYTAMNLISSHDVPRAMTVLSGAPDFRTLSREQQHDYCISPHGFYLATRRAVLAICLQMTLPGAPTVYYGDERGMSGYADPFNRCCIDWDNRDEVLFSQTALLANFRNETACLRTGFYKTLYCDDGIIAYMRYTENGKDAFGSKCADTDVVVVINPHDTQKQLTLDLSSYAEKINDALNYEEISDSGFLNLLLEPFSYRLLLLERNSDLCTKTQNI